MKIFNVQTPKKAIVSLVLLLAILAGINYIASLFFFQIDLTEDKRYTLSDATKEMVKTVDQPIVIENLFNGDYSASFKRLQKATVEKIRDFQSLNSEIEIVNTVPGEGGEAEIKALRERLKNQNIAPTSIRVQQDGKQVEATAYPVLLVHAGEKTVKVNLLENDIPGASSDVVINNSVSLLEYKIANAINKVSTTKKPIVMFTQGHGELSDLELSDFYRSLSENYQVGRMELDKARFIDPNVQVLIIPKPKTAFSNDDKLKIDQFIMNGGKTMWLIDKLNIDLDSIQSSGQTGAPSFVPAAYPLNIDDLLFKYGIRIKSNLLMDLECSKIPMVTGKLGNAADINYPRWWFHPVVTPTNHTIGKNMDKIGLKFTNTIDTLRTKLATKKSVLLQSSNHANVKTIPTEISFEILRYGEETKNFNRSNLPVGVLVEGELTSYYENRLLPEQIASYKSLGIEIQKKTKTPAKMIVISDGDIARNEIKKGPNGPFPIPLGINEYDRYRYANRDFLTNCVEYLLDESGLIQARNKEVKLRLLDRVLVNKKKAFWQFINIGIPLLLITLFGISWTWRRRKKYGK